jgi:hypothetical protein
MTEDKQPTTENRKFPFVKPDEGIFQVYSNYIDAAWTLFDVTIRFAQIVPLTPADGELNFEAEENARVTLAWPEVKVLANILNGLVKRFEEVNGEIKPLNLAPSPAEEEKKKMRP